MLQGLRRLLVKYLSNLSNSHTSFSFSFFRRGFGFVTFSDPNSVDKVLTQGTHELDGKKVCTIIYIYVYARKKGNTHRQTRNSTPSMLAEDRSVFGGKLRPERVLSLLKYLLFSRPYYGAETKRIVCADCWLNIGLF